MFSYQDININYKFVDNKSKKSLVFLHGWGQNIEMMKFIAEPFYKDYNVLIIDLPGHGKSAEPKSVWSLEDFALMVNTLVKSLKLKNITLVGHSFGGKISIIYASKYEVKNLVLLASPYKVAITKLSLKTKIFKKICKIKCLSKYTEKLKKKVGSRDYRNATPMMRNILVKHVNTDVSAFCGNIKVPTVIIWGTLDTEISIENAYELEKLIKDSAVIPYDGGTHFAYLEQKEKTIAIIDSLLRR